MVKDGEPVFAGEVVITKPQNIAQNYVLKVHDADVFEVADGPEDDLKNSTMEVRDENQDTLNISLDLMENSLRF